MREGGIKRARYERGWGMKGVSLKGEGRGGGQVTLNLANIGIEILHAGKEREEMDKCYFKC